ncbi:MAG: stalk domain-containing protein [Caldisericota bacterium]|nr:stalk domain-containing protein [Caldisericota bacterium]
MSVRRLLVVVLVLLGIVLAAPCAVNAIPIPAGVPVLVMQDVNPWGFSSHITLLTSLGYAPVVATWSDFGLNLDLADYANVYVASDQPTSFYNGYATHAAELTAWVEAGGHLVFSACDQGWQSGNLTTPLPGGAVKAPENSSVNSVVDPAHPIATGELSDGIPLASPFSGTSASHTYFSVLPIGARVIFQNSSLQPTLAEYVLGSGLVIVSGLTWEFGYSNAQGSKPAFDDLFLYSFPKVSYTLKATAGQGGTIVPSGTMSVVEGTSKSFIITADAGNLIASVVIDGAPVSVTNRATMTYTFSNITADHTIAASFMRPDVMAPVIELPDGVPQSAVGSPYDLHLVVTDDTSIADVGVFENGQRIGGSYPGGEIRIRLSLTDGRHELIIVASDSYGNRTERAITLVVDTRPPLINLSLPSSVTSPTLLVAGSAVDAVSGLASLSINGEPIVPFLDGSFSETLTLKKGVNDIVIEARDNLGNVTSQTFTVTYSARVTAPSSIYVLLTIGSRNMEVNGLTRTLDAAPFIKDGRTLLPVRVLVEVLGGTVQWNPSTKTATVLLGSRTVALTIGSKTALVNGAPITLDVAPEIKNGRTFLPLRALAENLGLDLAWEPISQTISLTYWP